MSGMMLLGWGLVAALLWGKARDDWRARVGEAPSWALIGLGLFIEAALIAGIVEVATS